MIRKSDTNRPNKTKRDKTPRKKADRCCNPDCPTRKPAYVRGLCEACYRTLLRLIERKKLPSLKDAESRGLCKGRKEIGSKRFPVEAARKVGA